MKKYMGKILLVLWALSGTYVLTLIHSWHYANLQDPSQLKVSSLEQSQWGIYHFLDPACSCSQSIFESLLQRMPISSEESVEKIFYHESLGEFRNKLSEKGYDLVKMNFRKLGVTGVPLLVVFDQNRTIRYSGGYSNTSINPILPPDTLKLIQNIQENPVMGSKPVIGCSVSKKYQKLFDPLGLKYGRFDD